MALDPNPVLSLLSLDDLALNLEYLQFEEQAATEDGDDESANLWRAEQWPILAELQSRISLVRGTFH